MRLLLKPESPGLASQFEIDVGPTPLEERGKCKEKEPAKGQYESEAEHIVRHREAKNKRYTRLVSKQSLRVELYLCQNLTTITTPLS